MIFSSFCSIILHSVLQLPSPDTLGLRVLLFSLSFPTLPYKIKAFALIENSPSLIIKSTLHHTPTPHTRVRPVLHYLLLTEKSEYIAIKAMMNFVCREVTCVSYRQTLLPLHSPQPSAELLQNLSQYFIRINNCQIYRKKNIHFITKFQYVLEQKIVSSNKRIILQETCLEQ